MMDVIKKLKYNYQLNNIYKMGIHLNVQTFKYQLCSSCFKKKCRLSIHFIKIHKPDQINLPFK